MLATHESLGFLETGVLSRFGRLDATHASEDDFVKLYRLLGLLLLF